MILITHDGAKPHAVVLSIEHNPAEYELSSTKVITDMNVPLSDPTPGMDATLMINTDTNIMFYNYTRPEVPEDLVSRISAQQAVIKRAMDDLIMRGTL